MFANTQAMGIDFAFPDVCLTPAPPAPLPVPTPYPNIATAQMAVGAVYKVLVVGAPAHNLSTSIPLSNGDNLGTGRGVVSGKVMGNARHTAGASTVLIGGAPATRMTSPSIQNGTNVPGMRIAPSQTKLLILAA